MKSSAFIFPGQGSQLIKMGFDFYNNFPVAKKVLNEASYLLKKDLADVIFNGSEEELKKTINSQLSISITSIMILEVLKEIRPDLIESINITAGHSLGEFTGLYFCNSLSLHDLLLSLKKRSELMSEIKLRDTGMLAILNSNKDTVDQIISEVLILKKKNETIEVANDNSDFQIILSGNLNLIHKFKEIAIEKGMIKKMILLPVEMAFHSSLMAPIKDDFDLFLQSIKIHPPKIDIVMNANAKIVKTEDTIKKMLSLNLISGVRWRESINLMIANGVENFYEIGPNSILTNMLKKNYPTLNCVSINSIRAIDDI